MNYLSLSEARKNLYALVNGGADLHKPTFIKGKNNSAVLISEQDWRDIQETLFVMQNKELR